MPANNIFILSQPIQTGKTSLLFQWVKQQEDIGGFLTPDINGKRKLYEISSQTYHDLQLHETDQGIQIGRFVFDETVFDKARQVMADAIHQHYNWIVIDEIGRLEMDRKEGLEPAVTNIINHFKTQPSQTKLLLVIRDYLLNDAINHYGLEHATVLDRDFFTPGKQNLPQPTGLILCGGQSTRMGKDKAFITYHQLPQYAHLTELMAPICHPVYISCNKDQSIHFPQGSPLITDRTVFKDAGPMTGLLSAFEVLSDHALLVVGCDYPYMERADLQALLDARDHQTDVVCFKHPDSLFEEPLLAIYEKQCGPLLREYYKQGNSSLRFFLQTVNTKTIFPQSVERITSIDSPQV